MMFRFKDMLLDIIKSNKINTIGQLVNMKLLQISQFSKSGSGKCRISQSRIEYKLKHPILLPKNGHIKSVIIHFYHRRVGHGRKGMTNEIWSNGFWVINCTAAVKSMILKCVDCRKLCGKTCQHKTSDLPEKRPIQESPFSYCGVDMLGPFLVKEGQKTHKRYGTMFTCL